MSRQFIARRRLLALVSAACVALACTPAAADDEAAKPTAVVVYGDRDNGFALTTLLAEVGLSCKPVRYADVTANWKTDSDLVVFASCCPGGWRQDTVWSATLLDRVGDARVIACGNTGASLLQTKALLVAHPHGVQWRSRGVAEISRADFYVLQSKLLDKPFLICPQTQGVATVVIQSAPPDVAIDLGMEPLSDHIGIFDNGGFPPGTVGIARLSGTLHHWIICQQGNYVMWGANTLLNDMSDEGRQLFANLAWQLAYAEPQPLIFPEKRFITERVEGKLVGQSRDEYYYELKQIGRLTLRINWKGGNTMTLLISPPIDPNSPVRIMAATPVEGAAPLAMTYGVDETMQGQHMKLNVTSSDLPDGEECPYELTLDWDD